MALEEIKEKLFEGLQEAKSRLNENDAYLKLKEKFESLPSAIQKLIQVLVGIVVIYVLLLFPLSFYNTAEENLALFQENRDLVLDLYRIKRKSVLAPQSAPPIDPSDLEGRARSAVMNARVQPEQIKMISFFDNKANGNSTPSIPNNIEQKGVEVRIANLNLTQVVDIAHAMSNLGSAKMIGFELKPGTAEGNYFDIVYKLVSFNIPQAPERKK